MTTTRMEWRGRQWVVRVMQGQTVIEISLDDWLKLDAVQYAMGLAIEGETPAAQRVPAAAPANGS